MPKVTYLIISTFISLFFLLSHTTVIYAQGTCEVVRVTGPLGRGDTKEVRSNCDSGYKPDPTFGTTDRCVCVAESIQLCQNIPNSCFRNEDCNTGSGCEQYTCSGLIAGRNTQGRCVDSTKICAEANITCSTDADCQAPGGACSQYTCWDHLGKSKDCRFGVQPKAAAPPPCTPGTPGCTSSAGIFCDGTSGIATAIGCIHTEPKAFIEDLMKFILGIGGGIAFLLMLFGVFEMITSAGNPERLKSGTDRFTSAIIGILFIVFSVLFMQIIGVDILGILPK